MVGRRYKNNTKYRGPSRTKRTGRGRDRGFNYHQACAVLRPELLTKLPPAPTGEEPDLFSSSCRPSDVERDRVGSGRERRRGAGKISKVVDFVGRAANDAQNCAQFALGGNSPSCRDGDRPRWLIDKATPCAVPRLQVSTDYCYNAV